MKALALILSVAILIAGGLLFGCADTVVVKSLRLNVLQAPDYKPPTGMWLLRLSGTSPYPATITSYHPEDKILVYIEINDKLNNPVKLSRLTIQSDINGEIILDLGAEHLSDIDPNIGWQRALDPPSVAGNYTLTVFFQGEMVAAANLKVVN